MRAAVLALAVALAACGSGPGGNQDGGGIDANGIDGPPSCVGLECFQVECPGGGTTSVSGTVHAPNGTLPLYNVVVYVPNGTVGAFPPGAQCDRCGTVLSGNPLVKTTTDTNGRFLLTDMPVTGDVPLVVQVGKWRRQFVIPQVGECVDTTLADDDLRLPRNQTEGDIPLMALTTGGADALECLLRKIGLDDTEFSTQGGAGRVHLYEGTGGTAQFDAGHGGGAFADAQALWGQSTETAADITARMDDYDVVLLSCEAGQHGEFKPQPAVDAMKAYADLGGRVFASHWHNYWLDVGPAPWPSVMTRMNLPDLGSVTADVNTGFDRGAALADWLTNVGASTVPGEIDIVEAQHTVTGVDATMADTWIHLDTNANGMPAVQYMSMTTPVEAVPADRCGRVVYSDIHVSSGDDSTAALAFPSGGCITDVATLTPQEKVLAFMIFDIASCVGPEVP